MRSRFEEANYQLLSEEPVTPKEVALKKTTQRVLMQLALTKKDVRYKNSGRIHLFWKMRFIPKKDFKVLSELEK